MKAKLISLNELKFYLIKNYIILAQSLEFSANDHLIEFHLIEIVIFHLIESFN